MLAPILISSPADLRNAVNKYRKEGKTIGFVPTMGALHDGHLSLVKLAKQHADICIVSIFVNPKQFGEGEDYGVYPRDLDGDSLKLATAHADMIYTPTVDHIYPDGFKTVVEVKDLPDCLCGLHRPGHFSGVTTIVSKLLLQVLPDVAVFGEKDFQQLTIIRRMVQDLSIPVDILPGSIVRDEYGLALSSRNQYLSAEELQIARTLNKEMYVAIQSINDGAKISSVLKDAKMRLRNNGFDKIDYLDVRDAATLSELSENNGNGRLFAAVHLGKTRLIDNKSI